MMRKRARLSQIIFELVGPGSPEALTDAPDRLRTTSIRAYNYNIIIIELEIASTGGREGESFFKKKLKNWRQEKKVSKKKRALKIHLGKN